MCVSRVCVNNEREQVSLFTGLTVVGHGVRSRDDRRKGLSVSGTGHNRYTSEGGRKGRGRVLPPILSDPSGRIPTPYFRCQG